MDGLCAKSLERRGFVPTPVAVRALHAPFAYYMSHRSRRCDRHTNGPIPARQRKPAHWKYYTTNRITQRRWRLMFGSGARSLTSLLSSNRHRFAKRESRTPAPGTASLSLIPEAGSLVSQDFGCKSKQNVYLAHRSGGSCVQRHNLPFHHASANHAGRSDAHSSLTTEAVGNDSKA